MFLDKLDDRLRKAGATVYDIRAKLPRRGTWMTRPLNAIKGISVHWDAQLAPVNYDPVARYIGQANYHINKDWGGGSRGDGLQYHIKIDRRGRVYLTRNFEEVLWNVSAANYSYIGICMDGLNQAPTREQIEALQRVLKVLTTQAPEIPAGQAQVRGHKEVPSNSTVCCGTFMKATVNFRNKGNCIPSDYKWAYQTPPPAPTKPEWERNLKTYLTPKNFYFNQNSSLYDVRTRTALPKVKSFKKGEKITVQAQTSVKGKMYWLTKYAVTEKTWQGIPQEHVGGAPAAPAPTPAPKPTPAPAPAPTPEPEQPSEHDKKQDQEIAGLRAIVQKIADFFGNLFK